MGFFSWKTSDTGRSIANKYSPKRTFTVYMITEDKQVFKETNYDGYGVFGGKDVYVLLAEMNGYKGVDDEDTRDLFFKKIWRRGIKKGGKIYFYETHFNKYDKVIKGEGKCANDLVSEDGWEYFGDSGEFVDWAASGLRMVKFVQKLPNKNKWQEEWDKLPYPESCRDQGFFYSEEDSSEDD